MRAYLLRRLLLAPLILLGVLTISFTAVHLAPGTPFAPDRGSGLDPEASARLRSLFGVDDPLWVRYPRWLAAFLTGDLGVSYTYRRPVSDVLGSALPPTLLLAATALLVAIVGGTIAGAASAAFRGRLPDRLLTAGGTILYAAPPFWIGVMLILIASVRLSWLPASGFSGVGLEEASGGAWLADRVRHLILPCLTLALPGAAAFALLLRAEIAAALASDHARAARARGLAGIPLLARHALRNAALPAVSLLGLSLPGFVGGALVVEVLFAWPGMGRITHEALLARDLPVVSGAVALSAAVTLAGSLLADLLYALLDPRVDLTA